MPILLDVAPVVPPGPDTPVWAGVGMTWTGWDGSGWDMLAPDGGVTLEAVRGLHMPAWDRHTSSVPALAGSRHRGSRTVEREVFWVTAVHSRLGTPDWVALDRAWWHSFDPDREGMWTVSTQGVDRVLRLRLAQADDVMDADPTLTGDLSYGVTLVAAQPFWEGPDVSRTFTASTPSEFFLPAGGVFFISPSNTLDTATMDNPGDEAAWPVWLITGPCTSATVGADGRDIVVPFALTAGQTLTIDTRPDRQTVVDHTGASRVDDLAAVAFGRVPAGGSVPLNIVAADTDAGFSVTATLTPLHRRAW